ncbi:MAG: hypothetical protein J6I84_04810 [Bacilli bacterium]|nr:hypothetical protein [Bacilli bacterium]
MIIFKQKTFSEYDAMRSLVVTLQKYGDRTKWKTIDSSAVVPVLRGNNVVIERFVISTSFLHRDRYRMYLKIGAKAKLPDEVRLPEKVYDKRLGNASLNINVANFAPGSQPQQKNNSVIFKQKEFKGGGAPPTVSANLSPNIDLTYQVRELLGEAVKYDKKARSLVLEFKSIQDAITALNILPFGIDYNIFLLK